jgi:15-cis-phytoene synthase
MICLHFSFRERRALAYPCCSRRSAMNPEVSASYRFSEKVARERARNFYYSFITLPPEKRRAFCAVYAFMRACDDVADGPQAAEIKREHLANWHRDLDAAMAGDYLANPILPAFHDCVTRFSIPIRYFHILIDGTEMDLAIQHYRSFDDLYRYCYHVASAVGLVSLQIFGYSDPRAVEYAEHCGIAFQLTNILRDIREDAEMGRIYLPEEDLNRFGYDSEKLRLGVNDENFRALMAFESAPAEKYYESARKLLPLVEAASRPALWAMMEIYSRILRKIVQRRFAVFDGPVRLSAGEKTAIAVKALAYRYITGGNKIH